MAILAQTPPPAPNFNIAPTGEVVAAGSIVGAILNYIWTYAPGVVTLIGGCLAIAWYALQLYESDTCKTWREARRERIKTNKIAKLKAKEKIITAELEALELKRSAAATAAELVRTAEQTAAEKVASATAEAKVETVRTSTAAAVSEVAKK